MNINISVACFTTCSARLKLYGGIKQLHPEQVLYFDTNSIIYHWKPRQPELPLGNNLGEFTKFRVAKSWDSLPLRLRKIESLNKFKDRLKFFSTPKGYFYILLI